MPQKEHSKEFSIRHAARQTDRDTKMTSVAAGHQGGVEGEGI
jgi:hypothetical protein